MKFTSVRKFVCVLSLTSIFSVGFASWTITAPSVTPKEILGSLQTDYVIKADNYVSFDNLKTETLGDGVVLPDYNVNGFISETIKDGDIIYANSSTANMTLYLVVDYENCKNLITLLGETKMDITITFTLQTDPSAFFNDTLSEITMLNSSGLGEIPYIKKNTATISGTTKTIGYTILLEDYDFSGITKDTMITLIVPFNSTGNETKVKDALSENQFIFNTSVHSY